MQKTAEDSKLGAKRILIADDSPRVRRGLRELLSERANWDICGEAENFADVLSKARELQPDLIILDVSMPGGNGFDAARTLHAEFPSLQILILSQHDPSQLLAAARGSGAKVCVDKSRIIPDLLPAMQGLLES